jgi:hypothetical protein
MGGILHIRPCGILGELRPELGLIATDSGANSSVSIPGPAWTNSVRRLTRTFRTLASVAVWGVTR